jgi:hypothetical protein
LVLFFLKRQLEAELHFDVSRIAFDGGSGFNTLHREFHLDWTDAFQGNSQAFPEFSMLAVVMSDPLPLMKRIRYRRIHRTLSFGPDEQELLALSTKQIQEAEVLSQVVFLESQHRN